MTTNQPVNPYKKVNDGGNHESHHEKNHDCEDFVIVEIERQSAKDFAVHRTFADAVNVRLPILAVESQAPFTVNNKVFDKLGHGDKRSRRNTLCLSG